MKYAFLLIVCTFSLAAGYAFPYQDPSLPAQTRINNLLSLLTLTEKAAMLEASTPAIPRIALAPFSYAFECERGSSSGSHGTAFPSGAGMASTFDAGLVYSVARFTALESKANSNLGHGGGLNCFAPVLNFVHDATWGRTNEMLTGEDVVLGATLGAAFTRGLQSWEEASFVPGDRPFLAAVSTAKHLNAYSGPEGTGFTFGPFALRFSFDVVLPSRAWKEFFLTQYKAVADAGAGGFMCSYSAFSTTGDGVLPFDNTPACASAFLLTQTIREDWGWDGFVLSDAGAVVFVGNASIGGVVLGHNAVASDADAAIASLTAGCDIELTCCGAPAVFSTLPSSVAAGKIDEAVLDRALARSLTIRLRTGNLDPQGSHAWDAWGEANVSTPEMLVLAREVAAAGVVLLKNKNHALPLDADALAGKSIAVIGPTANDTWAVLGGYVNTRPPFVRTYLQGLADALPLSKVLFDAGCMNSTACSSFAPSALALASSPDVALVVVALGTTGYYLPGGANNESAACGCPLGNAIEGECCDRTNTALPGAQLALLQALVAVGKPIILILNSGGYVDSEYAAHAEGVAAIVHAPFLGMMAGVAVADVLTGATNPSGRTTLTWYQDAARDLAPLRNYSAANLYNRTYRYTTAPITFPFGYGLSYASFEYTALSMDTPEPSPCQAVVVNVTVVNPSPLDGHEVVQIYGTLRTPSVSPAPMRQLLAFARVFVRAGSQVTVSLTVAPATHTVFANASALVETVEPGIVDLFVAGVSDPAFAASSLKGTFNVVGVATPLAACGAAAKW